MRNFYGDFEIRDFPVKKEKCKSCLEYVITHDGDRYQTSLSVGLAMFYSNNGYRSTLPQTSDAMVAQKHYCDPIRLKAVKKANSIIARVFRDSVQKYGYEEQSLPSWITRQQKARQVYDRTLAEADSIISKRAVTVKCPKCSALPGNPCENLTSRRKNVLAYTKSPHAERIVSSGGSSTSLDTKLEDAAREYREVSAQVSTFLEAHQEYKSHIKRHNQALAALKVTEIAQEVVKEMTRGEESAEPKDAGKVAWSPWPSDHDDW